MCPCVLTDLLASSKFKPRICTQVKPESSAEYAGLRLGDTLLEINGIPLDGMSDRDALDMIKQAAPTLELEISRLLPIDPLHEQQQDEDDAIFEDDLEEISATENKLVFDGLLSPSSPMVSRLYHTLSWQELLAFGSSFCAQKV